MSNYCKHLTPDCRCSENKRLVIMNEENLHDHTKYFNSQPLSSGRWDAAGSWEEAVEAQMNKCREWAKSLENRFLQECVLVMASDVNAFSLYERKAILEVVASKLGGEE